MRVTLLLFLLVNSVAFTATGEGVVRPGGAVDSAVISQEAPESNGHHHHHQRHCDLCAFGALAPLPEAVGAKRLIAPALADPASPAGQLRINLPPHFPSHPPRAPPRI